MYGRFHRSLFATSCLVVALGAVNSATPAVPTAAIPAVVADGIVGTVKGPTGPEAGVWVIAETKDLGTRFIKTVVTDDQGRFVVPELRRANYRVWVRGYGLIDSDAVQASPGAQLRLAALPAPDASAAAQYYPANYWWALLNPPTVGEFPGTGTEGNGINPAMKSQQQWLANLKYCTSCHQFGDPWMRQSGASTPEAWDHRIQFARGPTDPVIGNKGPGFAMFMKFLTDQFGRESALNMLADWGDRIAKGALPPKAPPRPTGVERNLVITLWDVGSGHYIHDEVASDRRDPTVNAHGIIYGIESNVGKLTIFNPSTMTSKEVDLPGGDNSYPHSVMMDGKGRAWVADFGTLFQLGLKPAPRPRYCSDGSVNKYANYFAYPGPEAKLYMYDSAANRLTTIPACAKAQHLWFDSNKSNTLYFAGDTVVSWIDTTVWDETHDPQKAMGWCPMVIDTKTQDRTRVEGGADVTISPDRASWNVLGKSADPANDTVIPFETYGLSVNPLDSSVWLGVWNYPGGIVRFVRGSNAPHTCKSEYYVPPKSPDGNYLAFMPHDTGIDSKGIVWVTFTSGQVGRFDRSKCKVLRGPTATGEHCPEGWTIYDDPNSPRLSGTTLNSDFYYQTYVDQHNVFGLGKDVPLVQASNSDAMVALMPASGKYQTFRIPYPMGYFARWTDARVDDPKAGWKGRALWSTYATVPVWHQEAGSDGTSAELVKFQLRPDPLAH
jgi:hypothetical protein